MDLYQSYIHISRYSRWSEALQRRETWAETVQRYVDFFDAHTGGKFTDVLQGRVKAAILHQRVMPSMRAFMTAGPALERENLAGFNCAYLAMNSKRSFAEALYILMCFHPDTLVVTERGDVPIKDVIPGDKVRSFNQKTKAFQWCEVINQVKTPSAQKPKVAVELDNGTVIRCTADHQWLTTNRGWVEAQHLTVEDDLVAPTHRVYKLTSKTSGKSYVGATGKSIEQRFSEHCRQAKFADLPLSRAINKHGADDFLLEQIDIAFSKIEAFEKEVQWIDRMATHKGEGYNCTAGGEGPTGYLWTPEQCQAASATRQTEQYRQAQRERNLGDKNPRFGVSHTDEEKAHLAVINTGELNAFFGKKHSDATKQRISEKKAGLQTGAKNTFFGRQHSEEAKAKMKASWASKREQKGVPA